MALRNNAGMARDRIWRFTQTKPTRQKRADTWEDVDGKKSNEDLDLRLRVAFFFSGGLPFFGAVSLPRGLPSFDARCFCWLQGGGVVLPS